MRIEFDPNKNAKNIQERHLSFERAIEFDFISATYLIDDRKNYGEVRYIAIGYLDGRLHVLCFVQIPDGIRVVSFRKANTREARKHGKPITDN
ncbi:MAG: BrnT family toxin [Methylovulum sp.]|nr:BrnT family toxin [Methylovulum sp.]